MKVRSVGVGRVGLHTVYMCEQGGLGRGGSGLRSAISAESLGTGRVRAQKRHLCCHTHLDTSVSWRWTQCQFGFREPIHLCVCITEEGGDGKGTGSEASSLLSYTLRYVSLTEVDTM